MTYIHIFGDDRLIGWKDQRKRRGTKDDFETGTWARGILARLKAEPQRERWRRRRRTGCGLQDCRMEHRMGASLVGTSSMYTLRRTGRPEVQR